MRPLPRSHLTQSRLNGKPVYLEQRGVVPIHVEIYTVMNGIVYASQADHAILPYSIQDYNLLWRLWPAYPDTLALALARWADEAPRLVATSEFPNLDKAIGYTIEFLDPRTGKYNSLRCAVKERFGVCLHLLVFDANGDKSSCNRWHIVGYGKTWRLWIGKPTKEDMEGKPWH